MARTKKTDDDSVVEADEYDTAEDEYDTEDEITADTESVTATDPAGNPVEIALSEHHVSDIIAEQQGGAVAVDEDVDFPGKEEDAELARQQHELGIDNQLIDPNED